MTYWLCITTQENWEIIKEKNVWGVPERHKNAISRVKPGDLLLIYVKQRGVGKEVEGPKVVAVYEAGIGGVQGLLQDIQVPSGDGE
jgi:predicted RNA-binding protein